MKAVLISIKPKYCELIASGLKTIELRKTRPKLDVPFKVYIYQTKSKWIYKILGWLRLYQGKVIGEYVCDDIDTVAVFNGLLYCVENSQPNKLLQMCLTIDEIKQYLGKKNHGYNWHISELKIYDKPKELSEFCKPCDPLPGCYCDYCKAHGGSLNMAILRPPQSWCYVEDLEV